jgi:NitT/TauT family transport system substrate-binding protein
MAQGIAAPIDHKDSRDGAQFIKAALHGMKDIMDDPDKAAGDFVRFVPEWKARRRGGCLQHVRQLVYPDEGWAR